jgi:transcriptional regulator with XRE-family HTH domain
MGEETNLGLWLRKRRLERELTQRELADLSRSVAALAGRDRGGPRGADVLGG